MADPVSPYIETNVQKKGIPLYAYIFGILVLLVIAVVIYGIFWDTSEWGEWVLEGAEPTCGFGLKKYVRICNLGSIASMIGKKCSLAGGLEDIKEEAFNIPGCALGRYVILERVADSVAGARGDDNALNIREIIVKSPNGTNLIVPGTTAEAGSIYSDEFLPKKLIDGDLTTLAHTGGIDSEMDSQWFKVDLGADQSIGSVEIYNRKECCQTRINGTRVRIVNSVGVDVFVSPVISDVINKNDESKLKLTFTAV
jgi:hypothetical protein